MNDITEVDRLNAEIADLKRTIEWYQGRTGIMMGAAARDEIAGAPVQGVGEVLRLIELLNTIKPNFGDVGSRDVEVKAQRERIEEAIAILSAAPASAPQDDALHFNAQRLRNVVKLVGLESAVPQDDATLDGARGAVLGQIAAKLRKQLAVPQGYALVPIELTPEMQMAAVSAIRIETTLLNKMFMANGAYRAAVAAAPEVAQPAAQSEAMPIPWQSVVQAIRAVDAEATSRGGMFPQTADERRADHLAAISTIELVEWYATKGGAVAEKLADWPRAK